VSLLRTHHPHGEVSELTRRAIHQANDVDELRLNSLEAPRTPQADADAAECRAEIRLRYPGLQLAAHIDVVMFCPLREHPAYPCGFNTNDISLVDEHFRLHPSHRRGTVKLNPAHIIYEGEPRQLPEAERLVVLGAPPLTTVKPGAYGRTFTRQ
jgi:hypothetical protein